MAAHRTSVSRRTVLQGAGALLLAAKAGAESRIPEEAILLPELPIVDPHHHLWDGNAARGWPFYHAPELLQDMNSGHRIVATVFADCHSHYRMDGPVEMQPVGETEFVVEQARADSRIARGIFSSADLTLGDAVIPVLEAQIAAGQGRFRGIRVSAPFDPDPVFDATNAASARKLDDPAFRTGFARLEPMGLSFDWWGFHTGLPQLERLAAAFPNTRIILDHTGSPLGLGRYAADPAAVFADWKREMGRIARHENVLLKFGGLGMALGGPTLIAADGVQRPSATLARLWTPWFESCLDLFGPKRIMFESNFPPDRPNASYRTLWNAFKRLGMPLSRDERTDLFSATAIRAYRLQNV